MDFGAFESGQPRLDRPAERAADRPSGWRTSLVPLLALVVVGVVLAFVWRGLSPHTAALGDEQ
jgi:hypothetical protein